MFMGKIVKIAPKEQTVGENAIRYTTVKKTTQTVDIHKKKKGKKV